MVLELLEGVPVDQLIALSCQALSIPAAVIFYHYLSPKTTSTTTRHAVAAILGIIFFTLLYGYESVHIWLMSVTGYVVIRFLPAGQRGWVSFAACVLHVLGVHLHTYIFHYMQFRVDVTHSLMPLAIKVSCTAFSLDDNLKRDEDLTKNQRKYKLKDVPTLFEYMSYCFCFLGALFGPSYHYSDYQKFIRGDQYKSKWPAGRAFKMLFASVICLLTHYILAEKFSAEYNLDPYVMSAPFLLRHVILWITMFLARCKYYFGWISSEAICYLCGLGYASHTGDDWPSTAVNPLGIEFATSLKMFSDNWNIFITQWLHFCVYERVKRYRVLCVFVFSATWHGFYPGYLMMFMPLAACIMCGRKLRKTLRPVFQGSESSRLVYDVITWIATTTVIAFNSCAFELKAWDLIYPLQRSFYFWPHIVVAVLVVFLPSGSGRKVEKQKEVYTKNNNNNGGFIHQNGHSHNGHSLHAG